MVNGKFRIESNDDKSCAHRKLSWRNSIEVGKKKNMANKIGICNNIGKHPPIGFTPAFLYKAIVACCFSIGFSFPNFSLISSISGFNARIFAWERYDLYVNGKRINLMKMVSNKIIIPKLPM